jgi:hypothetical protein
VTAHHLVLAVPFTEADHRDVLSLGELAHRPPEPGTDLLHHRRRRDRTAQVLHHERHHLTADLQVRHVAVEVDPVQALHIQRHMPIEKIVHRHCCSHTRQPDRSRQPRPARTSAVRGGASLDDSSQYVFDMTGRKFSADGAADIDLGGTNGQGSTWFNDINPGNTVHGKIAFDMPTGDKAIKIELHDSMFSDGVTVKLN